MTSVKQLRQQARALRRDIPAAQRLHAAHRLAEAVASLDVFATAQHISGYLAFDGEVDPTPLLERALAMGKRVYLPVLLRKPHPHMLFAPYRPPDSVLKPNYFGIPEPQVPIEDCLRPEQVNLVLTPLVAFDERGTRVGMGGGFYDRTFAFLLKGPDSGPCLLGLAYEMQKMTDLPRRSWDVPLHGIVTEEAFYNLASAFYQPEASR